jgi:hypothetical protein
MGLLLRLWQSVETAMAEIVVRATMRNYFKTLPQVLNTSLRLEEVKQRRNGEPHHGSSPDKVRRINAADVRHPK